MDLKNYLDYLKSFINDIPTQSIYRINFPLLAVGSHWLGFSCSVLVLVVENQIFKHQLCSLSNVGLQRGNKEKFNGWQGYVLKVDTTDLFSGIKMLLKTECIPIRNTIEQERQRNHKISIRRNQGLHSQFGIRCMHSGSQIQWHGNFVYSQSD